MDFHTTQRRANFGAVKEFYTQRTCGRLGFGQRGQRVVVRDGDCAEAVLGCPLDDAGGGV